MGTMDSLSILTSDIRLALSRGQHLVGVFLDISAAYDSVQLPLLRQKMQHLSLPAKMVHVICNLLMSRSICVRFQGSMLPPRTIWKGLPQGSVLSPILYSLYTAELEKVVDCFCDILQYADDIALYYASDSFSECTTRLNTALRYLNEWLSDHGLSLSAPKSSVVVFSRRRWIPDVDIVIDDDIIPQEDIVKFLGLYLDSRLTGIPHLNHVKEKCEKSINVPGPFLVHGGVLIPTHRSCYIMRLSEVISIMEHFYWNPVVSLPCLLWTKYNQNVFELSLEQ